MRNVFLKVAISATLPLVLAASALADENGWKDGTGSGLWSVAGNWWEDHVPTVAETLYVTNATPDGLTVTLDGDYASTATNVLTIGNKGGGTNTVVISGSLVLEREYGASVGGKLWDINVGAGGRLELTSGGEFVRRNGRYAEYNSTDGWNHYMIGLKGGGEFRQTGGSFVITNGPHQGILIGDSSGIVTSRYVMTGGTMLWRPEAVSYASWAILSRGRLEIGGDAEVEFFHGNGRHRNTSFDLRGGVFDLYGNAVFKCRIQSSDYFTFGKGTTIIRDEASFIAYEPGSGNKCWALVSPRDDDATEGATAHVIVKDSAKFKPSGGDGNMVIGLRSKTRAIVDISTDDEVKLGMAWLYVGCNAGYAELNLNGTGYVTAGGYSGMHVGADNLSGTGAGNFAGNIQRESVATAAPTGVVNMTSGYLFIGGNTSQAWNYQYLVGLVVGDGSRTRSDLEDPFESRLYHGEFYLSGGEVTNQAHLAVGAGRATGLMVQTGGIVQDLCSENCAMVVGLAGGHGTYALSNGTLTVKASLHVGGATTNQLDRGWKDKPNGYPCLNNYPCDRHDAKGRFTIACAEKSETCKLAVTKAITVSSDGAGLFEVVGTGSTITAQDMTVSNVVAAVDGGESVVKFVFDEQGISPITLSRKLTISEGAKLEVDMSAYKGAEKTVTLFTCGSRDGDFAPENMVLKNCVIIQEAAAIKARYKSNARLVISFR